jgi:hypothetical protein
MKNIIKKLLMQERNNVSTTEKEYIAEFRGIVPVKCGGHTLREFHSNNIRVLKKIKETWTLFETNENGAEFWHDPSGTWEVAIYENGLMGTWLVEEREVSNSIRPFFITLLLLDMVEGMEEDVKTMILHRYKAHSTAFYCERFL